MRLLLILLFFKQLQFLISLLKEFMMLSPKQKKGLLKLNHSLNFSLHYRKGLRKKNVIVDSIGLHLYGDMLVRI